MDTDSGQSSGQSGSVAPIVSTAAKHKSLLVFHGTRLSFECGQASVCSRLHQEKGRCLKVIGGETIDLACLFGKDYWLHKGMIRRVKRLGQSEVLNG